MIGASLSKPHTYDEYAAAVCMCIYIYIYIHVPYVTMAAAANLCRLSGVEGFQGRMRTKQG